MRGIADEEIRKTGYADARALGASALDIGRAARLFKVLAHYDRLRLACRLGDGAATTQRELIEEFGWPQSTAARHIAALREAGLIDAERDGAEIRLRMGEDIGLQLMTTVCDWLHGAAGWPPGEPVPGSTGVGGRAGITSTTVAGKDRSA